MEDPVPGSEASEPIAASDGEDNLRKKADRATFGVRDDLPKVIAFGVIAATIQMAILLALLYC